MALSEASFHSRICSEHFIKRQRIVYLRYFHGKDIQRSLQLQMQVLIVHQLVALKLHHKMRAPYLLKLLVLLHFHQWTLFTTIIPITHPYHHIQHQHI